jgi:hypothetical protein
VSFWKALNLFVSDCISLAKWCGWWTITSFKFQGKFMDSWWVVKKECEEGERFKWADYVRDGQTTHG